MLIMNLKKIIFKHLIRFFRIKEKQQEKWDF